MGVKIGPGISFADTINLTQKLCRSTNMSPPVNLPILDFAI